MEKKMFLKTLNFSKVELGGETLRKSSSDRNMLIKLYLNQFWLRRRVFRIRKKYVQNIIFKNFGLGLYRYNLSTRICAYKKLILTVVKIKKNLPSEILPSIGTQYSFTYYSYLLKLTDRTPLFYVYLQLPTESFRNN